MKLSRRFTSNLTGLLMHAVLLAWALIMLLPFLWMVSSSLKDATQVFRLPPVWIPSPVVWENYAAAWQAIPMGQYYWNSIVVTSLTTIGQLGTAVLAAYVFARLDFPGKDLIFLIILGTMMIPDQVKMIPTFIVLRQFDWIDSFNGLIVPALVHPFGIFMLRQFFLSIPKDLEDAARMDGSSRLGILFRVILPLSKAPISALAVFIFMFQWNSFLWPLIVLNSQEKYTLQIGLAMLAGDVGTDWALQMAATTMATLPLILLFLVAQKQFIRGIALTGLKS
jgi:multiple sugar transport system permease protein